MLLLVPTVLAEDRGYWDRFTTLDELIAEPVTFEQSDNQEFIDKLSELIFEEILNGDPNQQFEYELSKGPEGMTLTVRQEGATAQQESPPFSLIKGWLSNTVPLTDLFASIRS